jgi:hypothetical protein
VLDEHLDGPLTHLWGIGGSPWHCSILSREGASRIPGPIQPGESSASGDKRAKLATEILTALRAAHDAGLTPITQTALLKKIEGFGTELKGSVLHELADDPLSPVVMERDGKRMLYRLDP